jgi:hypothetical protein
VAAAFAVDTVAQCEGAEPRSSLPRPPTPKRCPAGVPWSDSVRPPNGTLRPHQADRGRRLKEKGRPPGNQALPTSDLPTFRLSRLYLVHLNFSVDVEAVVHPSPTMPSMLLAAPPWSRPLLLARRSPCPADQDLELVGGLAGVMALTSAVVVHPRSRSWCRPRRGPIRNFPSCRTMK